MLLYFVFSIKGMRRSRKFCQRGSNFDNVFFFFQVDDGREDPKKHCKRAISARQRNAI